MGRVKRDMMRIKGREDREREGGGGRRREREKDGGRKIKREEIDNPVNIVWC